MPDQTPRRLLRAIPTPPSATDAGRAPSTAGPAVSVAFCARCGRPPSRPLRRGGSRVCVHCERGLVLRAPEGLAPDIDEVFLVIDRGLSVCALSECAELLLDACESDALGRPVDELVMPVAPFGHDLGMLAALRQAMLSDGSVHQTRARVAGAQVAVRVGPCGPPRAALMVVGASG